MIWSNWIYLAIGLGLGVGSRSLFARSNQKSEHPHQDSITTPNPIENPTATTQEVSLTQKLKQTEIAYQLVQQMSQFKAGFLARTSHELRSPLNSLIGLHQIILSDLCDDPAEERAFVAQANSSALKLINLIDQILEVSRVEHGNSKLEIQPLQLATVLAEVYNLTHLLAANRNIHLHLLPPKAEIYVLADPRWLRQVLLNLLDTCFTQIESGTISISTQSISASELESPTFHDQASTSGDQAEPGHQKYHSPYAQILLDVNPSIATWSEPSELSQTAQSNESVLKNTAPSFGMNLLMTQTILELMQSRLEIVNPHQADTDSFTRLQLTIPLIIPEPETPSVSPSGN